MTERGRESYLHQRRENLQRLIEMGEFVVAEVEGDQAMPRQYHYPKHTKKGPR